MGNGYAGGSGALVASFPLKRPRTIFLPGSLERLNEAGHWRQAVLSAFWKPIFIEQSATSTAILEICSYTP